MKMDEKSAILEIINLTDDIDFEEDGIVKEALNVALDIEGLDTTQFGRRFISRLSAMNKGNCQNDNCVLCGKPATSKVVCQVCISNLKESAAEYIQEKYSNSTGNESGKSVNRHEAIMNNQSNSFSEDDTVEVISEDEKVDINDEDLDRDSFEKNFFYDDDIADLRQDIADRMHAETRDSDRYTEDLIKNLDASMDRLASKKAVKSSNRMLMAILVISLVNTISIVAIAVIVFNQLGLIK